MSRGLRNNNPGNIRNSNDLFLGEIRPSTDRSFKQFETMPYGYRAMFICLATYFNKYGRDTIDKIIKAWAPPSENDTEKYIATVESFTGINRYHRLTMNDGKAYISIVAAMSRMENGVNAVMSDVKAGFGLQSRIK